MLLEVTEERNGPLGLRDDDDDIQMPTETNLAFSKTFDSENFGFAVWQYFTNLELKF